MRARRWSACRLRSISRWGRRSARRPASPGSRPRSSKADLAGCVRRRRRGSTWCWRRALEGRPLPRFAQDGLVRAAAVGAPGADGEAASPRSPREPAYRRRLDRLGRVRSRPLTVLAAKLAEISVEYAPSAAQALDASAPGKAARRREGVTGSSLFTAAEAAIWPRLTKAS